MNIRNISDRLSVGSQLEVNQIAQLRSLGFTDIVCNRPDAEVPNGQGSAKIAKAAEGEGLKFHYIPVSSRAVPAKDSKAFADIVAQNGTRVFAYCRSGARSSMLWSMAGG